MPGVPESEEGDAVMADILELLPDRMKFAAAIVGVLVVLTVVLALTRTA